MIILRGEMAQCYFCILFLPQVVEIWKFLENTNSNTLTQPRNPIIPGFDVPLVHNNQKCENWGSWKVDLVVVFNEHVQTSVPARNHCCLSKYAKWKKALSIKVKKIGK